MKWLCVASLVFAVINSLWAWYAAPGPYVAVFWWLSGFHVCFAYMIYEEHIR